MYVRVQGGRVETCPISGTIPRGRDPLEDAQQVQRGSGAVVDAVMQRGSSAVVDAVMQRGSGAERQ